MSYVSIKFYLITPFPILKDVAGLKSFVSMLLQCNGVIQCITIHQKFIGTPPYYVQDRLVDPEDITMNKISLLLAVW